MGHSALQEKGAVLGRPNPKSETIRDYNLKALDYTEVTSAAMATTALLPWRRASVGLDGTLHDD